jgi:hypothetical protein
MKQSKEDVTEVALATLLDVCFDVGSAKLRLPVSADCAVSFVKSNCKWRACKFRAPASRELRLDWPQPRRSQARGFGELQTSTA